MMLLKRGQYDPATIIGTIFAVVLLLSVIAGLTTIWHAQSCSNEINQINGLNANIGILQLKVNEFNSTAEYWELQYYNLTNTTVTKKDYTDLNSKIELVINKIDNQQTQIYNLQQSIVNLTYIRKIYYIFYLTLSFFGLTLIDFIFLRFKITNWIIGKLYSFRQRNIAVSVVNKSDKKE